MNVFVKRCLILVLWGICSVGAGMAHRVAGRVLNSEGDGMAHVVVAFERVEANDSVSFVESGEDGRFIAANLASGTYDVSAMAAGGASIIYYSAYQVDKDIDNLELVVTRQDEEIIEATDLDEVQVTAKMLEQYVDRTEMYLTKYNRKFGINALDAISSLPMFVPKINSERLTSLKGADVNLLINGRRASVEELQNLKGDDIAKVVYYENVPAKYAGIYGGSVVDILLKKPKEIQVAGNISAGGSNAVNISGRAGATLMTDKHYLNATFNMRNSNRNDYHASSLYDYGTLVNSFEASDGHQRSTTSTTQLAYQLDFKNDMLYIRGLYNTSSGKNSTLYKILELGDEKGVEGNRQLSSRPVRDMAEVDLYYTHSFGQDRNLCIDVVNWFSKTSQYDTNQQNVSAESAYDSYYNESSVKNRIYEVVGNIMYSMPLWHGSLSASVSERFSRIGQNYFDNFYTDEPTTELNKRSVTAVNASYSRSFNRFSASLKLTAYYLRTWLEETTENQFFLTPTIDLQYYFSNAFIMNFQAWAQSSSRSLGVMNENRYFIDTYFFKENLSYMKSVNKYCAYINATLMPQGWSMMLMPMVGFSYNRHPYVNFIYRDGDYFIKRSQEITAERELTYGVVGQWMPFKGMQVYARAMGKYLTYSTPVEKVRQNWIDFLLNVSYTIGNVQLMAQMDTPGQQRDGAMIIHRGWSVSFSCLWKYKSFFANLSYNFYQKNDWRREEIPGFIHLESSYFDKQAYLVGINLGYSFTAGKSSIARKRKQLSNAVQETGFE